jgi:hypothetical protein
MEDQDARAVRLVEPAAEDILTDLTAYQVEGIRERVRESIELIESDEYVEYEGQAGLERLADSVKAAGRKRLAAERPSGETPPVLGA